MNGTSATRKAALWVGVVFLLGAALGGTLGYVFAHRVIAAPPQLTDAEKRAQKVQRSEEHTSELQSRGHLVCRLLLEKKKELQLALTKYAIKHTLSVIVFH